MRQDHYKAATAFRGFKVQAPSSKNNNTQYHTIHLSGKMLHYKADSVDSH